MTEESGQMTPPDPADDDTGAAPQALLRLDATMSDDGEPGTSDTDRAEDEQAILRIETLPRDVGWLLIYVGLLGVVLPGVIGFPFLVAGTAVLAPGGPERLTRWAKRKPSGFVHGSLKQISRLLDDLERRYPRLPDSSS